jgi:hypothetical protein
MTQFTCKGVKQINNRISFTHFYHSYLSTFFISAGVPNGEFPEIFMKNTESIGWLYDWFTFSPDHVRGIKQKLRTSRNKISMQIPVTGERCTIVIPVNPALFAGVSRVRALSPAWTGSHAQETLISRTSKVVRHLFAQRFITIFNCRYHTSNHLSVCTNPLP